MPKVMAALPNIVIFGAENEFPSVSNSGTKMPRFLHVIVRSSHTKDFTSFRAGFLTIAGWFHVFSKIDT